MSENRSTLKPAQVVAGVALFIVFAVCLVFAWTTRDAMLHLGFLRNSSTAPAAKSTLVDLRPWQTAQTLAALAVTAEELEYAREAERLADHEVDQAFTSALRLADIRPRPKTPEAKSLAAKVDQLQAQVKADQQRVADLSKAGTAAVPDALDDDLEIARAQLGLDSDELADAQQDLARSEGDLRGKINQELAAHRAMISKYNSQMAKQSQADIAAVHHYGSVARRVKAFFDQQSRNQLLQEAMQQAQIDQKALMVQHNSQEKQTFGAAGPDKAAHLAAMRASSAHSQLLSLLDDRIQSEQQLATVYGKWSAQVQSQHRIVVHLLLQSFALIAFVVLCLLLVDSMIDRFTVNRGLDWRRSHTLEIVFKIGLRFLGCVVLLLIIFGIPEQMPAVLGFATAGVTVVLQDFIVAFFGWFVLMGKNGIRVGDWVEINGVGGEVADIGLFRTALLETGNWTDKGHPTGRRVTFINSFAIRGQYFNFSTSGQWLWDEITLTIASSEDTYLMIEAIHFAVLEETEAESKLAQEEWKIIANKAGVGQFSAAPSVDLRPAAAGVEIVVRYVTKAADRFEIRNRIYQRVIQVMHKTPVPE